jgi:hypothetical protein
MHLGVARLCLDCHEVHEYERCPACTSEAFAFMTRWVKLENAEPRAPIPGHKASAGQDKVNTYREILQPTQNRSRAGRWLRTGGLLVTAAYVARWGWHIANRYVNDSTDEERQSSSGDMSEP